MKLYEVSDQYIGFLHSYDDKVLTNHEKDRTQIRPFLSGIIIKKSNYNYFIPLSSPDDADLDKDGNVRHSTMTIKRLFNKKVFLGKLLINNMIPILESEISEKDLSKNNKSNDDKKYIDLMNNQLSQIKNIMSDIIKSSNVIYNQKHISRENSYWDNKKYPGYLNATVNFSLLEQACTLWEKYPGIKNNLVDINDIKIINDYIRHKDTGYSTSMLEGKHFIYNNDLYRIDQLALKPLGSDSAILTKLNISGEEKYVDNNFTSDAKFNLHLQKIDSKSLSNFKDINSK